MVCRNSRDKEGYYKFAIARAMWGNLPDNLTFVLADGASDGITLLWDTNCIKVVDILKGRFSISVLSRASGSSEVWVCSTIYGPCSSQEKPLYGMDWLLWVIIGIFYVTFWRF